MLSICSYLLLAAVPVLLDLTESLVSGLDLAFLAFFVGDTDFFGDSPGSFVGDLLIFLVLGLVALESPLSPFFRLFLGEIDRLPGLETLDLFRVTGLETLLPASELVSEFAGSDSLGLDSFFEARLSLILGLVFAVDILDIFSKKFLLRHS